MPNSSSGDMETNRTIYNCNSESKYSCNYMAACFSAKNFAVEAYGC